MKNLLGTILASATLMAAVGLSVTPNTPSAQSPQASVNWTAPTPETTQASVNWTAPTPETTQASVNWNAVEGVNQG
ncbi:MAG: hypothetical protein M3014_01305 [Chloroflexota bacterium]|nr:hypothetical protein [Chloroflexota bacterium]